MLHCVPLAKWFGLSDPQLEPRVVAVDGADGQRILAAAKVRRVEDAWLVDEADIPSLRTRLGSAP